jgi:hypothetical protein
MSSAQTEVFPQIGEIVGYPAARPMEALHLDGRRARVPHGDLIERLSNRFTSHLLNTLTQGSWRKEANHAVSENGPAPDGRRPFGLIRDVVVRVLQAEPLGLRAREIHARAELLLGEPISRGSVEAILAARCQGKDRLFIRVSRGRNRSAD